MFRCIVLLNFSHDTAIPIYEYQRGRRYRTRAVITSSAVPSLRSVTDHYHATTYTSSPTVAYLCMRTNPYLDMPPTSPAASAIPSSGWNFPKSATMLFL